MSNQTLKAHASWGCLLGSLLLSLPLSAGDQSEPPDEANVPAQEAAAAGNDSNDKTAAIEAYRNCLRTTGSRITRAPSNKRCNNLPGSTYSREDIDRTGQTDVGRALERLDPRIRAR